MPKNKEAVISLSAINQLWLLLSKAIPGIRKQRACVIEILGAFIQMGGFLRL